MDSRRNFIGKVASGLAGTLAAPASVLGASERIRLGVIGPGERGVQLAREAMGCPDTQIVAFADVYSRRLEEARNIAPDAKTYLDYRRLLDDQSIDAVLIATPQHLHAEHFCAALDAGKHVYQEKTMAFTVEHAKRMRAAFQKAGKRTVQIGHQACSSGQVTDAVNIMATGYVGKITAIRGRMFRNTPHGKPQWSRPVFPDMTAANILWDSFLGQAPRRPFDANRYINWRFFWDYSGGNFHENMCHQLAFWYRVLDIEIPKAVTATGGLFLWKDGREVPDTVTVAMVHREELMFVWDSGFGNNHLGVTEDVLGADGTISRGQQIRYAPQKVNRPTGTEMLGQTIEPKAAHMRNFLECIRSGKQPNCPFELGYRVSIACRMAVESFRNGTTVRWDPNKEEIL
jgi:predicted dehydrogenase